MTFDLDDDEVIALMQCAAAGAQAASVLLGVSARPMRPIFEKIQKQFADQQLQRSAPIERASGNGATANAVDTR